MNQIKIEPINETEPIQDKVGQFFSAKLDEFFSAQSKKAAQNQKDGILTIGEAPDGYYRLLEGNHVGRVVIKSCAKMDNEPMLLFANKLTWATVADFATVRCRRVAASFRDFSKPIDFIDLEWYKKQIRTAYQEGY